jgi:hypothetical protein
MGMGMGMGSPIMGGPVPGYELDYLRLKAAELLLRLTHEEKPAEKERRNFFTMRQIHIAKRVMKIITADLSGHYPVEKRFSKKYIFGGCCEKETLTDTACGGVLRFRRMPDKRRRGSCVACRSIKSVFGKMEIGYSQRADDPQL